MKRPQPDIGDILKAQFLNNLGSSRKFRRLWGTTTINGVEVLNRRQYYYPDSAKSADYEKLFKFLGLYNQVEEGDYQGVDYVWLYLNKNKGSDFTEIVTNYDDFVADNLNELWGTVSNGGSGYTLTTDIVIEGIISDTNSALDGTTSLLDPSWTEAVLIQTITDNYDTLWDTCHISQQGVGVVHKGFTTDPNTNVVSPIEEILSPEDPWVSALARNALRSTGVATITGVEIGLSSNLSKNIQHTYVITVEIPYVVFDTLHSTVLFTAEDIEIDYPPTTTLTKLSYPNGYFTKQEILAMDSRDLEELNAFSQRNYTLWEDIAEEVDSAFASAWYQHGGVYYLKADIFTNPKAYGITYKNLFSYIVKLIDTGHKKTPVPWWKKLLAAFIFIISIIFAPVTGGWSLNATNFALALVFANTVMIILSLVFSALGMHEMVSAFAEVMKFVEPLVIMASIFLAVSNLVNMLSKALETGVDKAIQEVVENAIKDFVEEIVEGATDVLSGKITSAALKFLDKMAQLVMLPQRLRLSELKNRNVDLQAEYDELLEEISRESDILAGFMRIYARPATADWSMYAATFDFPYERGGGTLSIGNIQRTTKQALRPADYKDSAFDNILVV